QREPVVGVGGGGRGEVAGPRRAGSRRRRIRRRPAAAGGDERDQDERAQAGHAAPIIARTAAPPSPAFRVLPPRASWVPPWCSASRSGGGRPRRFRQSRD